MVKIEPFEVERWMDEHETTPGALNIAETCAASVSVADLVALCDDDKDPGPLDLSAKLTYGSILGSRKLRQRIADLLESPGSPASTAPLLAENIIITQGAIAANFLLFYTLVGPGDHVVCVYPTYQQLYSVPESLGAEVTLWKLKQENGYVPDVGELESLVKPNTKMIVINNPNNPTGSTTPASVLQAIVAFASSRGILVFSDEVYSPLFHSLPPEHTSPPPSVLELGYEHTVVTGSMSKAFALAGIRLGWVASRDHGLLRAVASARDYTNISVSQLDDQVAAYALSPAVLPSLLGRNLALAHTNLELLSRFLDEHASVCQWVKPTAGTTALIRFARKGVPVEDDEFALRVLGETKVLFTPASRCFGRGKDFKGFVRLGYACHTNVLREGLERLGRYVEEHLL